LLAKKKGDFLGEGGNPKWPPLWPFGIFEKKKTIISHYFSNNFWIHGNQKNDPRFRSSFKVALNVITLKNPEI